MPEISTIKQRDIGIDAVRGMAILLVVFGHVIQYQNPASYDKDATFRVIYSFHMPLFFFVSGVVASLYGREVDINLQLFMKRTRALLYPWGVWALFVFLLFYIRNPISLPFAKAIEFYWFLPVLFILHIASFVIIASHKSHHRWYIMVLLITSIWFLMFLLNGFWISSIRFHAVYFASGFFIATHCRHTFNIGTKRLLLPMIFLISLTSWYLTFNLTSSEHTLPNYLSFLSRVLSALFGILTVWATVTALPEKIKYLLTYLGKYSLQIYLIHLFIIQFVVFSPTQSSAALWSIILWSIIFLSSSIMIATIVKRIGLSRVLFGR
jgi:fucose 4-O-acetylase-like acetyltransferase